MDPEDFLDLMNAHQAGLYRYAKFLGDTSEEAKDTVKEVFIKAYYAPDAPGLKDERITFKWLRGFAREVRLENGKRSVFGRRSVDIQTQEQFEEYWAKHVVFEEDFVAKTTELESQIQGLSERQMTVLKAHYETKNSSNGGAKLKVTPELQRIQRKLLKGLESEVSKGLHT